MRGLTSAFFIFFSILWPVYGEDLPTGMTVESGEASVDTSQANTMVINASDQAVLNFDTFSIGQDYTVQFIQPSDTASVLARVIGSSSSNIFGNLFANGELVLVNPHGINFGQSAMVNAGSLIASTLNIPTAEYLNRQLTFEKELNSEIGRILNDGQITAADGGHLVMLADSIENRGTLTANLGSVVLGAGEKQTLSFDDQGVINFVIDRGLDVGAIRESPNESPIQNTGDISASGGKVILNAQSLNDTLNTLVKVGGTVEATRAIEKDGKIQLVSSGGVEVEGDITASEVEMTAGGNITALGSLIADTFSERAVSFGIGGIYHVGLSFHDNLDGAITYLADTHVSGQIEDIEDIIINDNITLTLDDDTTFTADSDLTDGGSFTMNPGSSIVGGNYFLTINSSGTTTLYDIPSASTLSINITSGDLDLNGSLTITNWIESIVSNDINVKEDVTVETDYGHLYLIAGNNLNIDATASEKSLRMNGIGHIHLQAGAALVKTGTSNIVLDAVGGNISLRSQSNIITSDWLPGANSSNLDVRTSGSADIIVDESFDLSGIADSEIYFSAAGNFVLQGNLKVASSIHIYANNDLTLDGNLSTVEGSIDLEADMDQDGMGSFTMNEGSSIDAGGGHLEIYSSGETTLREIVNVNSLYVDTTNSDNPNSSVSLLNSITAADYIVAYADEDIILDGDITSSNGYIYLGADSFNEDGTGVLTRLSGKLSAPNGEVGLFVGGADIRISDFFVTAEAFESLEIETTGNADITVDQSLDKSAVEGGYLKFSAGGDIILDTETVGHDLDLKVGENANYFYLKAGNNDDNVNGSIQKVGPYNINADASGVYELALYSNSDIRLSDWLHGNSAVGRIVHVEIRGDHDIIIDRSLESEGSYASFYLRADRDIVLDTEAAGGNIAITGGEPSYFYLEADHDWDGTGSLTKTGDHDVVLDFGAESWVNIHSASTIRTSDWISTVTSWTNLEIETTGAGHDIIVDQDFDNSILQVAFRAAGDLIFDTATLGDNLDMEANLLNLQADSNWDGTGVFRTLGPYALNLNTPQEEGTLILGMASDMRVSDWITGVDFMSLYFHVSGEHDVIVDQSLDPGGSISFFASGDIIFDTEAAGHDIDLTAGSAVDWGSFDLRADDDGNGNGTIRSIGPYDTDVDMSTARYIKLSGASDIRLSDWLKGDDTVQLLDVETTGNHDIIIDQSIHNSNYDYGSLYFNAAGDIIFDTTPGEIVLQPAAYGDHWGDLTFRADRDNDGTGALSKMGNENVALGSGHLNTYSVTLQSASDIRTSDWLTVSNFGELHLTTHGPHDIFVDQAIDVSSLAYSIIAFESGRDLLLEEDLSAGSNIALSANNDITINGDITAISGNVNLDADNDDNGTGSLTMASGTSIQTPNTLSITSGGTATLQNLSPGSLSITGTTPTAAFSVQAPINMSGDLTLGGGRFYMNGNNFSYGNFVNNGGSFFNGGMFDGFKSLERDPFVENGAEFEITKMFPQFFLDFTGPEALFREAQPFLNMNQPFRTDMKEFSPSGQQPFFMHNSGIAYTAYGFHNPDIFIDDSLVNPGGGPSEELLSQAS